MSRAPSALILGLTWVLLPACGDDGSTNPFDSASGDGGVTQGETTTTTAATTMGATGTGSAEPGSSSAGVDDTTDPIFDVNPETGAPPETCIKVDVLYIIDNSPSMYDEQQTLIANFGTFVADMQQALADVDSYHIGVITTDDFETSGIFDDGWDTVNESYPECQSLGGLVVEAHSGACVPFADGHNFITESDVLEAKFSCVANVGEDGDSDEKVGDALISLLDSQAGANPVSGCNAEFLRNDALLILVILTDENDSSDTSPAQWYQAVVEAKGVETNVVALSLVWNQSASGCEESLSETNGYTITEFTEMFTNHSVGNICDDSYAGFFSATLPVIEGACADFEPVG